jgi:ferric enterobactin receptor
VRSTHSYFIILAAFLNYKAQTLIVKKMRSLTFLFFIFFFVSASAQQKLNTRISGKILDKSSKQPLEYATVSVIDQSSGKTVNGTIAEANGTFSITSIPYGTYRINIGFVGYINTTIDSVSITSSNKSVSLGSVFLASSTVSLQGVTITSDKPVIENKIDKIVYNATSDITSQGGLAIDVLKKVPQISVDIDGNVELQGNSNIRFLINGKPSSVFGNSLADALASIPASQIKSIEAITNPGAKYDSQGTGGIINIILQDNKMKGVNGNINLSAGTRLENGSANFNFRHKNFGVNAFFGLHGQLTSKSPSWQNRTATDTSTAQVTSLIQDGLSEFYRNGIRSGAGFDWDLSKNDNITGSIGYNHFGSQGTGFTNQIQRMKDSVGDPGTDIFSERNSANKFSFSSVELSLDYKKKFSKEGQELEFLINNSNGMPYVNYSLTQSYTGESNPYMGTASTNPGHDRQTDISLDYAHPVTKNFTIETGIKAIDQKINSKADVNVFNPVSELFVYDNLQSYNLNYNMRVYAGYLSASFPLFNFLKVKTGARYEYTDVNIDLTNASIPSYGTFVPSVILSHDFNKNTTLKLAYNKRIERPEYRELNPFINLSDPYNLSTGNPFLKPEIGNNFELGLSKSFEKGGNIYIALLERFTTQDIKQVTLFYPEYMVGDSVYTNVSVTNNQNVGREYNTGISLSGSWPVTKKLNLRGNFMFNYRYMVSDMSISTRTTGFRGRLNMNATYQLPKNLVAEMFGIYSLPSMNIQGKMPQFFVYTFAFRKLFWDKKASFGFTTTNPFSQYVKQVSTISTNGYVSESIRKLPLRSFGISFTYKFGKLEFSKSKEKNDNNQSYEENGRN